MNKKQEQLQADKRHLADIVIRPILTEKATIALEDNFYTFDVVPKATKPEIKAAIEYLFDVKVEKVNTLLRPRKKRRVGRFLGYKAQYKRAYVKLAADDEIQLYPDV